MQEPKGIYRDQPDPTWFERTLQNNRGLCWTIYTDSTAILETQPTLRQLRTLIYGAGIGAGLGARTEAMLAPDPTGYKITPHDPTGSHSTHWIPTGSYMLRHDPT